MKLSIKPSEPRHQARRSHHQGSYQVLPFIHCQSCQSQFIQSASQPSIVKPVIIQASHKPCWPAIVTSHQPFTAKMLSHQASSPSSIAASHHQAQCQSIISHQTPKPLFQRRQRHEHHSHWWSSSATLSIT